MAVTRTKHLMALAAASWLALATVRAADEEALARAKDLYLSASYDEALAVLDGVPSRSAQEALEIAEYRVFCLLALNRGTDAQKAIEALVKANPFYQPSETVVSPRIRSVFVEARRRLMSSIVQSAYVEAKAAFDRKDPRATALFERVLDLLADPGVAPTMLDLRTVAAGFRDLSSAAANASATRTPPDGAGAPTPPGTSANPAAGTSGGESGGSGRSNLQPPTPREPPSSPQATGAAKTNATPQPGTDRETNVTPPEAVYQPMPTWIPPSLAETAQTFRGSLELSIDENGNVVTARMRRGAHPRYDDLLVKAAQTWRFKPARRDGVSIPYVRIVEIELRPPRQ